MRTLIYTILVCLAAPQALAEAMQPLASIREAVHQFVAQQVDDGLGEVEIKVTALDSRLRLASCASPLRTYFPNSVPPIGNITVGVSCEGDIPWSLMVPVQVHHYVEVAVVARPLGRNHVINAADLQLSRAEVSALRGGYFATAQEVEGMVLRRALKAGTVLDRSMVKPALLVKRGERVQIGAVGDAVAVYMDGQAMQAGAKGEVIRVRNLSSRRMIDAVVVAPGVVHVRL